MGKAKKKSVSKARRTNFLPTAGRPVIKENPAVEAKVTLLVENLTSEDLMLRSGALSEITLLCDEAKYRSSFLKKKLVKILLENFLNKEISDNNSLENIIEAYGLLRNICIEEGYDTTVFLWRQGLIDIIANTLKAIFSKDDQSIFSQQNAELLENILSLLSAMAVSNDEIFDDIQTKFGSDLPRCLVKIVQYYINSINNNTKQSSSSLFSIACEALYVFSQDVEQFIKEISSLDVVGILENTSNYPILGVVYLNGVKYNMIHMSLLKRTETPTSISVHLLEILKSFKAFLSSVDLESVHNSVKEIQPDKQLSPQEIAASVKKSAENRTIVEGIQITVEIITAISETISVDPKKQDELIDKQRQMQKANVEDIVQTVEDEEGVIRKLKNNNPESSFDEMMMDDSVLFENNGGLEPIFKYLQSDIVVELAKLLSRREYTSRVTAAFNNIAWSFEANPTFVDSGESGWEVQSQELWKELLSHVGTPSEQGAQAFVEIESINSSIGALWGISSYYQNRNGHLPISLESVKYMISQSETISQLYPKEEATEHHIRLIGLFKSLSSQIIVNESDNEGIEKVALITQYLFKVIETVATKGSNSVNGVTETVVIESIYSLFEIFGDDEKQNFEDYNKKIYVNEGLNQELKKLIPGLKNQFKRINKSKEFILKQRAAESLSNLESFIEYKESKK